MRIAFVSTILSYPWGGADTLWTRAAEAAQERGDSLLLAVSTQVAESPRVAALIGGGARHFPRRVPPEWTGDRLGRLKKRLGRLLRRPDPLTEALRRFRPDLVVFSCGGTYDLLLERPTTAWLRSTRTPYRLVANWQVEHPDLSETDRAAAAADLRLADLAGFVSTRNLDVTRRHLLEPLPNARVLHNPLRWTPADETPWPAGPELGLATVSRLEASKGISLFIHAAAHALGDLPDWHIDIFGRGPAEAYLAATTAHLGLGERVRFRGYVPQLRDIWAGNHLMVSPAIDDGVPMTIPEAMLCGRPVLATAVGGAEDWIVPGACGFVCPAPTLPLLADSLKLAWEQRGRWQAMGVAAAARAREHYRPGEHLLLIQPCPQTPSSSA